MTITTATSSRSLTIRSSITLVDCGSSAEHGSSSSSTSGCAASARAMHSRCCWPPESRSAGWSRLSSTSSSRPARASAVLDRGPQRLASRAALGLLAQHVGDVVEHAHRERVRLLEDHRHPPPQRGRLERRDVHAVERDPTAQRCRLRQLGEPVERAQQRRLATSRGADQRQHLALADRQRDRLHGELLARRRSTPPPRCMRSIVGTVARAGRPALTNDERRAGAVASRCRRRCR